MERRIGERAQLLAELAISIAILAIGIVSTIIVINGSIGMIKSSKRLQASIYLAIEEMELVRNIKYPYPDDPTDTDQYNNISSRTLTGINRAGYVFDIARDVTNTQDTGGNYIKKQIEIKIYESGSSKLIITYRTILTSHGI